MTNRKVDSFPSLESISSGCPEDALVNPEYLEQEIDELREKIATYDEKIAKIAAVKVRYELIVDVAPDNQNALLELAELSADMLKLYQYRDQFVEQRKLIRKQIDNQQFALNSAALAKKLSADSSSTHPPQQGKVFETLNRRTAEAARRIEAGLSHKNNSNLAPVRHLQTDFFVCDLVDYALKDDQASMEAPIFSLSTREDMKLWTWTSEDGKKSVEVSPGFHGRATQHDKDILIYCTSQLTEAINQGLTSSKTIRFTAYDFLVSVNRSTRGGDYERLRDALKRLAGTQITTNILTGESRISKGFGIIDSWEVVEKSPDNNRMVAVEVTLSDWLFNSIQAHEVLTIHPDYFRLRKSLERRLYEIARKHVGKQGLWKIGLNTLHSKSGSTDVLRNFKVKLKEIIEADTIPQYRYQLGSDDLVTIYDRDPKITVKALV